MVLIVKGVEVLEVTYGDGAWDIIQCPPTSHVLCQLTLQKSIKQYCNSKIISKTTTMGFWFQLIPICHLNS